MFNLIFSTLFMNSSISPKVYIALTGVSSLLSGLLLVLEWWHYNKYGTSFLENISMQHIGSLFGLSRTPALTSSDSRDKNDGSSSDSESNASLDSVQHDLQVGENPYKLFRGAEYYLYEKKRKREPLTFYDMNLSSTDHQNMFPRATYRSVEEYEIMQQAWRERSRAKRVSLAKKCLEKNNENIAALLLVAEEGEPLLTDVEKGLREALRVTEQKLAKKKLSFTAVDDDDHAREFEICMYIRRRLGMVQRKLGKYKEAIRVMKDLLKEIPLVLDVHENLIECLLEMRSYADVQAVMAKYDDVNLPKSATIVYTAALMKCRAISDRCSPDALLKKTNMSQAELSAVEAIHRAVEFNPHVPKYLLEERPLILPPEHIVRRGDSEAVAYAFVHIDHWKRVDGATHILQLTWEQTFRSMPSPFTEGHYFHPYPYKGMEAAERDLMPTFHELSVYPRREFSLLLALCGTSCSVTAIFALLCQSYPGYMSSLASGTQSAVDEVLSGPMTFMLDKVRAFIPSDFVADLARF